MCYSSSFLSELFLGFFSKLFLLSLNYISLRYIMNTYLWFIILGQLQYLVRSWQSPSFSWHSLDTCKRTLRILLYNCCYYHLDVVCSNISDSAHNHHTNYRCNYKNTSHKNSSRDFKIPVNFSPEMLRVLKVSFYSLCVSRPLFLLQLHVICR